MPRVRLAWILPPVQVALAETAMQLGRHAHPPVRGDIYWYPTVELIYYGLNTPADRLSIILFGLLPSWGGVISGDLIYVLLAAALGYLVARKIDSYRFSKVCAQDEISSSRIVWNLLAALYGLYLLLFLCLHNVIFTNPRNGTGGGSNFYGDLMRQGLWLLWSLVLIVVPSVTMVFSLRRKLAVSPSKS